MARADPVVRRGGAGPVRPGNIVWASADLVVPARAGGQLRSLRLLTALAAKTPVHLALLHPEANAEAVLEASGATSARGLQHWPSALAKRRSGLRHQWPLSAAAVFDPALHRWVSAVGGLVIADHVQAAVYLDACPRSVLSLHNDDARMLLSEPASTARVRRMEQRWDRRTLPRLQAAAVAAADLVVCVSEQDRDAVSRPDAAVVPNGADLPDTVGPRPEQGSLLFVGSMNYPPNEDAVRWWVEQVAPLLPPSLPLLTVVGRGAQERWGHDSRVTVHSDVPEIGPFLAAASVVVVPVRHGGGSRLKLIEAMAGGRPVVSTRKGAEGFPVQHDRELLLADEPADFAEAVTRLWTDAAVGDRLAAAAVAFAEDYSWERVSAPFVDAVLALQSP
jgi:glycosyltransferase involved in cell wall biosynthesis